MSNNFILAKFAKLLNLDSTSTPILKKDIQPVGASVLSNALTVTLGPTVLEFRSTSLTSGVIVTRTVPTTLSLVVPSGATLGTLAADTTKLVILAIDNAGTVELAITNSGGILDLREANVITTSAITSSSNARTSIYSTTARTNVAFRVVGYVEISEATPGLWATSPTLVQGVGGVQSVVYPFAGINGYNNGFQKLPGGFLIQWNNFNIGVTNTDATVTFPIPFPTTMVAASVTPNTPGSVGGTVSIQDTWPKPAASTLVFRSSVLGNHIITAFGY